MTQSITLTASMRSNLSSLKTIQNQMDTTQTRLSTGKKVNSAIDNASSFYQARSLNNRAADLDALLDSMGQGIQTIQAANEGIESVTAFVDQLKSVATSAYAAASGDPAADLTSYEKQYNSILTEMYNLVQDSSYQGINLLNGGNLTVTFDENRTNNFVVSGKDMTADLETTQVAAFKWDANNEGDISWGGAALSYKKDVAYTMSDVDTTGFTAQTDVSSYYTRSGAGTSGSPYVWTKATGTYASGTDYYSRATTGTTTYTDAASVAQEATVMHVTDQVATYADANGNSRAEMVEATLDSISKGFTYLRDFATELGNNFSIIETRQNFTESLINVLETGADNLVLADMNEESANYLALQTRQQLAINSLALASQSAQSVLKLY